MGLIHKFWFRTTAIGFVKTWLIIIKRTMWGKYISIYFMPFIQAKHKKWSIVYDGSINSAVANSFRI
jgi:hypothetical protein